MSQIVRCMANGRSGDHGVLAPKRVELQLKVVDDFVVGLNTNSISFVLILQRSLPMHVVVGTS